MDLKSVASVIGRHRGITTLGVALALALAFVAAFRVDLSPSPQLERRQAATYESTVRLFVTQEGFPWGRSALRYTVPRGQPPLLQGDPGRFAQLAQLYAQLANSDRVQRNLAPSDEGAVIASVVNVNPFSSDPLPMVDIAGRATSPGQARRLAATVTNSLLTYIRQNQQSSGIPADERVVLQVIDPPRPGKEVSGPSPALPALVLLTVLFATVFGVFVLDNWRFGRDEQIAVLPAVEEVEPDAAIVMAAAGGRRSRFSRPESAPTLGHQKAVD
jgi:hypothetical protein